MLKKTFISFIGYLFSMTYLVLLSSSCENPDREASVLHSNQRNEEVIWCVDGVGELLRGDILVRPNLNLLPGTSSVSDGRNFGHAALVIKGFKHSNPDSLLAGAVIVESIAKDVSKEFQVREIHALAHHKLDAFNNVNFDASKTGNRYRLRLQLTEEQIDAIVAFAMQQKGDFSSWNASKRLPPSSRVNEISTEWADNSHWYCSLLVWQSVLAVTGTDLDPNKGYMVYPNDLIHSPYFFNKGTHVGRARF
jgi:hypothetical protein